MAALSDTEYSIRKIEQNSGRKNGMRSAMVIQNASRAGRWFLIALMALAGGAWQKCAAQAQGLKFDMAIYQVTQRPDFPHSIFGVEVFSFDENKVLYALNGSYSLSPSSSTMLLTDRDC